MSWKRDYSGSGVIREKISKIVNRGIKGVEYVFNKRVYINIIVILLSAGLIVGYYLSINDKEYWADTYKTVTEGTANKIKIFGTTFVAKTQNKLEKSMQIAYSNSYNALNKKSFHKLPNPHIRSKTSVIEIFTNKTFNTIDDSKNLRLGELKWKLFSKIQ
ncbi:MAG TPA: hypothetical protein VIK78_12530 [Ruminiclostridium sp.]